MTIVVPCFSCHKEFSLNVEAEDFYDWREGLSVQNAFPYLSADDRELLISRTCGVCWDEIFSDDLEKV